MVSRPLAAVLIAAAVVVSGCSGAGDGNAVGEQRYIEGSGATTVIASADRGRRRSWPVRRSAGAAST